MVDVGANVGLLTVLLAAQVGPSGHVYAFEPERKNFELLRRNVELNSLANVTLIRKAVSDHAGWRALYESKTNNELHRLHPSAHCSATMPVECTSLDESLSSEHRPIALIKVDVEGHEHHVLSGMRRLTARDPHVKLFIEFNTHSLHEAGIAPAAFLQLITELGFHLMDAHSSTLTPCSTELLLERYPTASDKVTNLWCSRSL